MTDKTTNIWKALTLSLVALLILGIAAYFAVVYLLPGMGLTVDIPLIKRLGEGVGGLILGVLVMVIAVAIPIFLFLFVAALFGLGFGIGLSISPIGKALMQRRNS